jgi:hypothetical protein
MKCNFIFFLLIFFFFNCWSQDDAIPRHYFGQSEQVNRLDSALNFTFTSGLMYGGGALFGFEIENKFFNRIGIQHGYGFSYSEGMNEHTIGLVHLGINYLSFGAGLNYHFKPTLKSSYISFQYWTQGVFNDFLQGSTGPVFVYRGKKSFTAQIGLAYVITKEPILLYNYIKKPFMLTYAIGFYLAK